MGGRNTAVVKSRAKERGRKSAALCQRIHEVSVVDRKTQITLQLATNTSCYLIQQLIKEVYLRRTLMPIRPLLTEKHKIARMYVMQHADGGHYLDPRLDVMHLDESVFSLRKWGSSYTS
ncbi:hypothetical protein PHYPSEUDO_002246 [Phytophthora pseudosyringae]|uniref:Transposase Tc1-like domain-containing protein n=1 Tax=Phytophthora pseudosyringae TaxID=221518 RepID=A0A8T1VXY8_9STRA|nr:hypothetical protein PHYPSEUDO_002246 [Phytophthora pseudosyringae]